MTLAFEYDENAGVVRYMDREIVLSDPEAFDLLSQAWLRCGWDTKYVYGFSWLGRPIIQLPEDMVRIQELIYNQKPDVIIETGIAHGGSLVFYASLCTAIGKGRVIGVDVEIRKHNRDEIDNHRMRPMIEMVEGSSISPDTIEAVRRLIGSNETVLVILDSNHSKQHVLRELELYSSLIKPGGYIVACDGIMQKVAGAPRSDADWSWNNPVEAVNEFLRNNPTFTIEEPLWPFNEGAVQQRVTYWPSAYLKRHE